MRTTGILQGITGVLQGSHRGITGESQGYNRDITGGFHSGITGV